MITHLDLVDRLSRRNLGGRTVVERIQDLALPDQRRSPQRRDHPPLPPTPTLPHDVPRARGSPPLAPGPVAPPPDDLIDQAIPPPLAAVAPAWSSTPPAAPAHVNLVNDDLIKRGLDAVALRTLAQ